MIRKRNFPQSIWRASHFCVRRCLITWKKTVEPFPICFEFRLFNLTLSSSDQMASNGQTLFGPGGDTNKIRSKLNFNSFYVHNRTKTCKCFLIYNNSVFYLSFPHCTAHIYDYIIKFRQIRASFIKLKF